MYTSELSDLLAHLISTAFILVFLGGVVYGFINNSEPIKFGIVEDLKKGKIPLGYIDDDSELVDYNEQPAVITAEVVKENKKKKDDSSDDSSSGKSRKASKGRKSSKDRKKKEKKSLNG